MRNWIWLVLIAVGLVAVSWFWERSIEVNPPSTREVFPNTPGFWEKPKQTITGWKQWLSVGEELPDTSGFWEKSKQTIADWIEQPHEMLQDLTQGITQTANEKTAELKQVTEQGVREKLAEAILPAASSDPTSEYINPEISAETQNFPRLDICLVRVSNQSVRYRVANPFYNQTEAKYRVDWGDGENLSGTFTQEEKEVLLSHLYRTSGTYRAIFEVKAPGATVRVESKMCGD
ncbi:MAG: hypothetical protein V1856_01440 [Candidatus Liptonbacteria bacterium]